MLENQRGYWSLEKMFATSFSFFKVNYFQIDILPHNPDLENRKEKKN